MPALYDQSGIPHASQDTETTSVPPGDEERKSGMCKMVHYSAARKKEILPLEKTRKDLEGIMLREISQTEKHR